MEFKIEMHGVCDKCNSEDEVLIGIYRELEVREDYICKDCVTEMLEIINRVEKHEEDNKDG